MRKRERVAAFGIGLGSALIVALLGQLVILQLLEYFLLDLRFSLRGPQRTHPELLILSIDDATLHPQGKAPWAWPLGPGLHAEALRHLREWGAELVAFDTMMSEVHEFRPEIDLLSQGEAPTDQELEKLDELLARGRKTLAEQIRAHGRVVWACKRRDLGPDEAGEAQGAWVYPIPEIQENAHVGHVHLMRDVDGTVRRHVGSIDGLPSFPEAVLRLYPGLPDLQGRLRRMGQWINFPGAAFTFPMLDYRQVVEGKVDTEELQRLGAASERDLFGGKLVLVGATSTDLQDIHPTPLDWQTPGVEIHAAVVHTVLRNDYIQRTGFGVLLALAAAAGLFAAAIAVFLPPVRALAAVGTLGACYLVGTTVLFVRDSLWLPQAAPVAALLSAYLVSTVYRLVIERRREAAIRNLFGKFVSPQVAREVLRHPELLKQGGERSRVTVLFSDLRGFTHFTEHHQAAEVVETLNRYFEQLVDAVNRQGGMVNKFMGDAILAVFGAPIELEDHARKAVRAAVEMQKLVQELRRAVPERSLDMGIGVVTGEVIAGKVGSTERLEYTIIGDAVNVASRLQAIAEGGTILLNEEAREEAASICEVVSLGPVRVKGRDEPVHAFELMGLVRTRPGDRRRHLRAGAMLPVRVRLRDQEQVRQRIGNLSGGGLLICSRDPLPQQAQLSLDFELPPPSPNAPAHNLRDAAARVIEIDEVDPVREDYRFLIHAEFESLAQEDREQLQRFVYRVAREQAVPHERETRVTTIT